MKRRFFYKLISIISAVCLILPIFAVQVSAEALSINVSDADFNDSSVSDDYLDLENAILEYLSAYDPYDDTFLIYGSNDHITGTLYITLPTPNGDDTNFDYTAIMPNVNLEIRSTELVALDPPRKVTISGTYASLILDPSFVNDYVPPAPADPAPTIEERPAPEVGETADTTKITLKSENHLFPSFVRPTVEVTDDKPFEKDGTSYAGTVDITSVDTDTPQEIPKEVFIDGLRYLVGETVYIVGEKEKIIETTADTGFSYVFTAVENSDYPVKFTAEGLPEGLVMSEDGVITTKTLPAPVGTFKIKVTADNGADTNVYEMTIEIKAEMTDEELLKSLTENDIPELLTVPQENVYKMWVNEELSIHYEPDIDDFYAVFLDGKLLSKDDYRVEEGSTVIILTEQTIAPLPNGDHVVTTMFHQDSDVGLDTVINDVGSSSFVFRFGDEKSDGKRLNISGDGVSGSVTFDDKDAKETPITTISANKEAIEQRAKNLSNATGKEIIAAFETKQSGGFGGKTATFAVSAKSLDLNLKDGTAVYIAVYDSKSGKTYQNKGTVKDGMIVFKTKHSGVFMISLEKY